jgi:hypothetical protein
VLDGLAPAATGAEVTIYDPGLDPTGRHTASLSGLLTVGRPRRASSAVTRGTP